MTKTIKKIDMNDYASKINSAQTSHNPLLSGENFSVELFKSDDDNAYVLHLSNTEQNVEEDELFSKTFSNADEFYIISQDVVNEILIYYNETDSLKGFRGHFDNLIDDLRHDATKSPQAPFKAAPAVFG